MFREAFWEIFGLAGVVLLRKGNRLESVNAVVTVHVKNPAVALRATRLLVLMRVHQGVAKGGRAAVSEEACEIRTRENVSKLL
jgi:hypothetical protein